MKKPETITATEASRHFSDILHRVCYGGESFVIKKGNRLMARILPVLPAEPAAHPERHTKRHKDTALDKSEAEISPKAEEMPRANEGFTAYEAEYFQALLNEIRNMPVGVKEED